MHFLIIPLLCYSKGKPSTQNAHSSLYCHTGRIQWLPYGPSRYESFQPYNQNHHFSSAECANNNIRFITNLNLQLRSGEPFGPLEMEHEANFSIFHWEYPLTGSPWTPLYPTTFNFTLIDDWTTWAPESAVTSLDFFPSGFDEDVRGTYRSMTNC